MSATRLPGSDEHVAGVRVAVEDARPEQLPEGGLDDVPRHLLLVVPLPPGEIAHLDAVDVVERQHRRRGERVVDARDDEERQVARSRRHVAGRCGPRCGSRAPRGWPGRTRRRCPKVCRPPSPRRAPREAAPRTAAGPRSASICSRTLGRCTLTATSAPPWVLARCTCAIEALAAGTGSSQRKSSSTGRPRPRSISWRTSPTGMGVHASWRRDSSSIQWGGSMSGRVERSWPSLMNVGPRSTRSWRKRAAVRTSAPAGGAALGAPASGAPSSTDTGRARGTAPPRRTRSRYAPNPCRAITAEICRSRFRSWMASRSTSENASTRGGVSP